MGKKRLELIQGNRRINLKNVLFFFEKKHQHYKHEERDIQVNVELDEKLHRIERIYYDEDDMSIHIVASHDTIPEPSYTPLWHIKHGIRIMNEPKAGKEDNDGVAG